MNRRSVTFDAGDIVQEGNGIETVQCALAIVFVLSDSVLVNKSRRVSTGYI
jgi:hypothetical protein